MALYRGWRVLRQMLDLVRTADLGPGCGTVLGPRGSLPVWGSQHRGGGYVAVKPGLDARGDRGRISHHSLHADAGRRARLQSHRKRAICGQNRGPARDYRGRVRGTDCTERKLLFVRLRQHRRFWFDKTLAEVRFTVTNASLSARYYCNGGVGEKGVFTEAWLQLEEKHKSGPVKISACG